MTRDEEIKSLWDTGKYYGKDLGVRFNISIPRVYQIARGGAIKYCKLCHKRINNNEGDTRSFHAKCKAIHIEALSKKRENMANDRLENKIRDRAQREELLLRKKESQRLSVAKSLDAIYSPLNRPNGGCYLCGVLCEKSPSLATMFRICSPCRAELNLFKGRERTREARRIRDGHTCQMCGKMKLPGKRRLDIHHLRGVCGKKSRSYDKLEELDNLITLCHKCHFNMPDHTIKARIKTKPMDSV